MKKLFIELFFITNSLFSIFCYEVRIKSIELSLNGRPFSCGCDGILFFDKNDLINIRKNNNGNYDYYDIVRINDNCEKSICNNISELKNDGMYPKYMNDNVVFELKYGYKVVLSSNDKSLPIIMQNPKKRTEPSMFNHGDFRPIPYFLYIKDKNDNIVFDLNKYRLDHEEFYPKGHYTSTSRYEEFSKNEARRQLSNDLAWTMYQGCTAVNRKQNRIAIILNQYNIYDDALCIFEVLYDAVCNDDRVRVRTEPNLNCETKTFLNKNDAVKIIDQSDKKIEIDGKKYYWYEVELADKSTGWVYGKYLDIEK